MQLSNMLSPRLNAIYRVTDHLQFFLNFGSSYHSNDVRSVVQEQKNHQLPRSWGTEVGTLIHSHNNITFSAALWWLDIENELVYVGDNGTTENKGASRRTGVDLSARCKFTPSLFADADLNISKNMFIDTVFGTRLKTDYHIPLAPVITSAGGQALKQVFVTDIWQQDLQMNPIQLLHTGIPFLMHPSITKSNILELA